MTAGSLHRQLGPTFLYQRKPELCSGPSFPLRSACAQPALRGILPWDSWSLRRKISSLQPAVWLNPCTDLRNMNSPLSITYVGHATCLVEMEGVRILTDPILRNRVGPIRRQTVSVHNDGHERIDAVAISHLHRDHLDMPSLRRIDRSTRIIVP